MHRVGCGGTSVRSTRDVRGCGRFGVARPGRAPRGDQAPLLLDVLLEDVELEPDVLEPDVLELDELEPDDGFEADTVLADDPLPEPDPDALLDSDVRCDVDALIAPARASLR